MCNAVPTSPNYSAHTMALISLCIFAHYNNSGVVFRLGTQRMGGWISGERQVSVRTQGHETGQTGSEYVLTSLKS